MSITRAGLAVLVTSSSAGVACSESTKGIELGGGDAGDRADQGPLDSGAEAGEAPRIVGARVTYAPGFENPLLEVDRATEGTTIVVELSFSEPVARDASSPAMTASRGDDVLRFSRIDEPPSPSNIARFEVVVDASRHGDGVYTPQVRARDPSGNALQDASFGDPAIRVDTTADALVVRQDRVSFLRSITGNDAREPLRDANGAVVYELPPTRFFFALGPLDPLEPTDALPADTFRLADGSPPTRLLVATGPQRAPLLTVAPRGDGAWSRASLVLPPTLRPRVYVAGVDAAGNVSAPVRIVNAWLVASPGPTFVGASHELARADMSAAPGDVDEVFLSRLETRGWDGRARAARTARRWIEDGRAGPPFAESGALVFDPARGRAVLISGRAHAAYGGSTAFGWDGAAWSQLAGPPGVTSGHAAAYDRHRSRTIVFGGIGPGGLDTRTRLLAGGWSTLSSTTGPPARVHGSLVFDETAEAALLFGGEQPEGAVFDDTWSLDAIGWSRVASSTAPSARAAHAMAYDASRAEGVLFGGRGADGGALDDTWVWDGGAWVERTVRGPGARYGHAMAYDAARSRVVLFGGVRDGGAASDVWEWDGDRWTEIAPSGPAPGPARWAAMTYDAAHGEVLLAHYDVHATLWAWDGQRWTRRADGHPRPRRWSELVYHGGLEGLLLFGGRDEAFTLLADTWSHGADWRLEAEAGPPAARFRHALAYDAARDEVVLFGGAGRPDVDPTPAGTWIWDGAAWRERTPASEPPPRTGGAMAYDRRRGRVVLHGGDGDNDTWTWDGSTWTELSTSGPRPPIRGAFDVAYDVTRDRLVLFGGFDGVDYRCDVWEHDGARWSDVTPGPCGARSPDGRAGHTLSWDADRERVVLQGGRNRGPPATDTWEWDGAAWRPVKVEGARPPVGEGAAAAWDAGRGRLSVFGGGLSPNDELWTLEPAARPAIQLAADVGAELEPSSLRDVRVRAVCGGVTADLDDVPGAELWVWTRRDDDEPEWRRLAAHDAALPPEPPSRDGRALLDYAPDGDGAAAARELLTDDGRVYVRCTPRGDSGQGYAEVALDYVEVRLRYATSPE